VVNTLKSFYRGFFKEYRNLWEGTSFWIRLRSFPKHFIEEFYWQHRYAWQRMWRGYDSTDIFNLDSNMLERLNTILKDFKIHNIALFNDTSDVSISDDYEFIGEVKTLSEQETNDIIDKLIYLSKRANEEPETFWTDDKTKFFEEWKDIENSFIELLEMLKKYGRQINY